MESIHHHFSKIAHRYRDLRVTDVEPIIFIKEKLHRHSNIVAADIGCGAGRYDLKLLQSLGKRLFLYCIDVNGEMLKALRNFLLEHRIRNFQVIRAPSEKIPLKDNRLDCIFTFNAIHHFGASHFFEQCSRLLKNTGHLFIYTRLRSQNRRNIWGKYFPLFDEKENRLYELHELRASIEKAPGLEIEGVEYFKYARLSSLHVLLERARNHHYSTFYLYTKEEFDDCLNQFEQSIRKKFKDPHKIGWSDENVLLVVRKRTN